MFDGENRRVKILAVSGAALIVFVFLFLQAIGGLINSGTDAQPDLEGATGRIDGAAAAIGAARSVATSAPGSPTCTVSRGPLPDVTCAPTPAQVSAATGIAIPANATNFTSHYEQFQDWHLDASFVVADPSPYLGLADFPGLTINGGPVQAKQATDGSYRTLELASQPDGTTVVTLTAFTT